MDGTMFKRLIMEKLGWPNAITIDYITNKLVWADAHLNVIEMSDMEGNNRQKVDLLPDILRENKLTRKSLVAGSEWYPGGSPRLLPEHIRRLHLLYRLELPSRPESQDVHRQERHRHPQHHPSAI